MRHPVFSLLLRLAVAGLLLALLFRLVADWEKTWAYLRGVDMRILFVALPLAIAGEIVTAFKWKLLIRHVGFHLPMRLAVHASFVGMFYNNFAPGSVGGDVARTLIVAPVVKSKAKAAASAFMQRNTGLAGLLVVGNVASWIWPMTIPLPGPYESGWYSSPAFWFGLITLGYVAVNGLLLSRRFYIVWNLVRRWSGRLRVADRLAHILHRLHEEVILYRGYIVTPLLLSILSQVADSAMVFLLAKSLGMTIGFAPFLISVPLATLAALVPVTFNGIGLREAAYALILGGTVVSNEAAIALALLHFVMIAVLSLGGGLVHAWDLVKKTTSEGERVR